MLWGLYYRYLDAPIVALAVLSFLTVWVILAASGIASDDRKYLQKSKVFRYSIVFMFTSISFVACANYVFKLRLKNNIEYNVLHTIRYKRKVWLNDKLVALPRLFLQNLLAPVSTSGSREVPVDSTAKLLVFEMGARKDSFELSKNLYDSTCYIVYSLNNESDERVPLYQIRIKQGNVDY